MVMGLRGEGGLGVLPGSLCCGGADYCGHVVGRSVP